MDASAKKSFGIKVKSLVRILKEFKSYKKEVESYDMNQVSQDKKKEQFYKQSKCAYEDVEKKLLEYYQQLTAFIQQNQEDIESEEDAAVKADLQTGNAQISEIKELLPGAC